MLVGSDLRCSDYLAAMKEGLSILARVEVLGLSALGGIEI